MKKPDRKAFTREFGPRGAAKYATAMRKYRKAMKNKGKSNSYKLKESEIPLILSKPAASKPAASKPASKPAASKPASKPAASKPAASKPKKGNAASNFFRSSSGTRGSNVPSNPKLMIQPKKKPKKNRRGRTVRRQDDYRLF